MKSKRFFIYLIMIIVLLIAVNSNNVSAKEIENNDSIDLEKFDLLKKELMNYKTPDELRIELVEVIKNMKNEDIKKEKINEMNIVINNLNNKKIKGQKVISIILILAMILILFVSREDKLNNIIKWSLKSSIKDFINLKILEGSTKEDIVIKGLSGSFIDIKEISTTIEFLIEDKIIEYIDEDSCAVTEEYYNWMKGCFKQLDLRREVEVIGK